MVEPRWFLMLSSDMRYNPGLGHTTATAPLEDSGFLGTDFVDSASEQVLNPLQFVWRYRNQIHLLAYLLCHNMPCHKVHCITENYTFIPRARGLVKREENERCLIN